MSNGLLMSESFKATVIFFKVKIAWRGSALLPHVQGQAIAESVVSHHTSAAAMQRGRN